MGNEYWDLIRCFVDNHPEPLEHHGIKGQKWGVKNGPPYPLNRQTHNAVIKGKIHGNQGTLNRKEQKDLDRREKELLRKLAKDSMEKTKSADSRSFDYEMERMASKIDSKTGFHLKAREMTLEEDMARVNPGFSLFDDETTNNCSLCTVALEMRRRGYEVQAQKSTKGYGPFVYSQFFETKVGMIAGSAIRKSEMKDMRKPGANLQLVENAKKAMLDMGDGTSGGLSIVFKNGYGEGHSVHFTVNHGKIEIQDAQINYTFKGDEVDTWLRQGGAFFIARLDNAKPKFENMKEACR